MTATPTPTPETNGHSSLVGGSTASKRLHCPGSYQMEAKLPVIAEESSSYADEGTALHAAIQYILEKDIRAAKDVLGMEFGGSEDGARKKYKMTQELCDEALDPCIEFFDGLDLMQINEGGLEYLLERRCEMPGIPDAFGTCDLIGRTQRRSIILDWKFGAGVPVSVAKDGEPNAQLMFYGRAAMHTHPEMFGEGDDWPVDLYIVQPRARMDEDDSVAQIFTVTRKQLEEFRWKLIKAVSEATGKDPSTKRGEWCRFAKCKTICPLFTGPALDLTKMHQALESRRSGPLGGIDIDWAVALGDMMSFADVVEELVSAIRAQAHAFLADGNQIIDENGNPLYKLVPRRPTATWVDAKGAVEMALKRGAKNSELYATPEPKSPAQMRAVVALTVEAATKKAKEEQAKELLKPFFAEISSGDTLASINDRRVGVVPASAAMRSLSDKLAAIGVR